MRVGRTSLQFVAGGLGLAGYRGFGPGWISRGPMIIRPEGEDVHSPRFTRKP